VEDLLSLLLELAIDEVLEGLPRDALDLVILVLLVASSRLFELHLLVSVHHWGEGAHLGSVNRIDGESQLLGAAQRDSKGQLKIVVILNDDPVVTVVVTEAALCATDAVVSSQGLGLGHKRVVVSGEDALDHGALA